jgi:hypothetical protein
VEDPLAEDKGATGAKGAKGAKGGKEKQTIMVIGTVVLIVIAYLTYKKMSGSSTAAATPAAADTTDSGTGGSASPSSGGTSGVSGTGGGGLTAGQALTQRKILAYIRSLNKVEHKINTRQEAEAKAAREAADKRRKAHAPKPHPTHPKAVIHSQKTHPPMHTDHMTRPKVHPGTHVTGAPHIAKGTVKPGAMTAAGKASTGGTHAHPTAGPVRQGQKVG